MTVTATASIAQEQTEESRIRTDLAACYRLLHKYAMTDLIFTHVSARLPGTDGHFLLNPYGLMFNEITASSLVEVDAKGTVVGDGPWGINWAGYVIHGAILAGRPDVNCVLHTPIFQFGTGTGWSVSYQGPFAASKLFALYSYGFGYASNTP